MQISNPVTPTAVTATDNANLLTVPRELRDQIYSYLTHDVDFIMDYAGPKIASNDPNPSLIIDTRIIVQITNANPA